MLKKTVVGEFEGNKFTVKNSWIHGTKLFLGSELIGTNNEKVVNKKGKPVLRAEVMIGGEERIVEVFAHTVLNLKMEIKLDGEKLTRS